MIVIFKALSTARLVSTGILRAQYYHYAIAHARSPRLKKVKRIDFSYKDSKWQSRDANSGLDDSTVVIRDPPFCLLSEQLQSCR